jgi:tetratricopeptide (TPR) repeat protein
MESLISRYPHLLQAYASIGDYYRFKGQTGKAVKWYSRGLDQGGGSAALAAELHFARAAAYDQSGDVANARKDLEAAVAKNAKSPALLNYYGYFLVSHEFDVDKGMKSIEMALAADPGNAYYIDSYGWAYYKLGNFAEAVRMLEYAYAMSPRNAVIIDHLGDAYAAAGRYAEAKFSYAKALAHFKDEKFNENLTESLLREKLAKY